jgi:two-component system, NtrC family, nitrogen regulation sensor histidine kinase NtrY
MNYKYLYSGAGIRIALLSILLLATGYAAGNGYWFLATTMLIFSFLAIASIYFYTQSSNRKLRYFLEAIKNNDSSIHFSEHMGSRSMNELHRNLNKLRDLIFEIQVERRHNEQFFIKMIDHSTTGLMAIEEKGYVELINHAALDLIGLPSLAHIELLKQKNPQFAQVIAELKPGQVRTIKFQAEGQLRQFSVKTSLLTFGKQKYQVVSLYDIKNELEENELDSWQKLISVMTHEIMNSIAPITSLSNTLQRFFRRENGIATPQVISQNDIDQTLRGLVVIEQQGRGLVHFVEAYRKLIKIPKPVFSNIVVADWLTDVRLLVEEKLKEENVKLELLLPTSPLHILGDIGLLSQVLLNLLNNSIDALNGRDDKLIRIRATNLSDGKVKFELEDNGSGIDADELEKIFIPFYTTKEKGSGIGLSLARQIMRLHKGTITVSSIKGKHTIVILTL